jgi:hypothetical protein
MPVFEAIVNDYDEFERVFQEGLKESEAIEKDYILSAAQ